jgi:putative ABC transport system permease protein
VTPNSSLNWRATCKMHIEDNVRRGMTPELARRAAVLKLGGIEQTRENYRDRRGLPWLDAFSQDLRYTFRRLRKDRAFARWSAD